MDCEEAGAVILIFKVEIIIHKFNILEYNLNGNETEREPNMKLVARIKPNGLSARAHTSIH